MKHAIRMMLIVGETANSRGNTSRLHTLEYLDKGMDNGIVFLTQSKTLQQRAK